MSDSSLNQETLTSFLATVKPEQMFWALEDKESEDWVVLDSINFENSEVMPLWATAELAQAHCIDEWQNYQPAAISIAEWLEFWIEDLKDDGVIIGINWQDEQDCVELDLSEFSQALAEIEAL